MGSFDSKSHSLGDNVLWRFLERASIIFIVPNDIDMISEGKAKEMDLVETWFSIVRLPR